MVKSHIMFSTVDRPNPQSLSSYRPRYTPTVWLDAGHEQEPPDIMFQYAWKPPKKSPSSEPPSSESPDGPSSTPKEPAKKVRPKLEQDRELGRKDILDELAWEHPTVTLDLGTLNKNVAAAFEGRPTAASKSKSKSVVSCIRGAVREALSVKRHCQELIGNYVEAVFFPHAAGERRPHEPVAEIDPDDTLILNDICPHVPPKASSKNEDDGIEDGHGQGKSTAFLQSFLAFLYSGNMPQDRGLGPVSRFIRRLQKLKLFPETDRGAINITKEYTPSFLVRSVASQLAAELKRQYKHGAKELAQQVMFHGYELRLSYP